MRMLFVPQVCIQAMGHTECISPLKQAMQARKDMIGVVCEALNRLFSTNHDQLISQVGHTAFATCFSPTYHDNMEDPHQKFAFFFLSSCFLSHSHPPV
jgi:DnaJ family protein C protein 13